MSEDGPAGPRPMSSWLDETRASYDADAPGYRDEVDGILDRLPHLRAHLRLFADLIGRTANGPVADIGCGPGYATGLLHDLGLDAFGIDLSPEMIEIARREHPGIPFEVGTMTDLDLEDESLAGLIAFWSTIHIPDDSMPGVLDGFHRILRTGGSALIGFHVGEGLTHSSSGYTRRPISLDTHLRRMDTMSGWLRAAGFAIDSETLFRPDERTPAALVLAHRRRSTPARLIR